MERNYLNMSGSVTYEKWTEMFHDERHFHWVRSARIWSFSGPHFPSIGMKTYSLRMRIGTDQKKLNTDTLYAVFILNEPFVLLLFV